MLQVRDFFQNLPLRFVQAVPENHRLTKPPAAMVAAPFKNTSPRDALPVVRQGGSDYDDCLPVIRVLDRFPPGKRWVFAERRNQLNARRRVPGC